MKALLAAVVAAILSLFGIHQAPVHTAHASPSAQVASAVTAVGDPLDPASYDPATTTPHSTTTVSTSSTNSGQAGSPQTTIVKQYITQPVVERIIQSPPMTSGLVLGASTDATAAKLSDLQNQINALANLPHSVFVPSFSGPAQTTPVNTATFAQSQKIHQLSGTSLSGITVSGVSGLTDADISDGITASSYLPIAGGTLSGDLTLTGNLTVSGAQTLSGAITIPYLTATSTTADSSFVRFTATNGTTTNATSTNLAVTGTASTSALVASNSFTFKNVTGFLKAVAGVVSEALVDLAANVTGILPVCNGGTGWANIAASAIPYGSGSGALATTTAGTAGYVLAYLGGVPTWTATTTLSTISGTLPVGSGGTNATSLGSHMLLGFNGTSVVSTSTPTAAAYFATSTTASIFPYASSTAFSVSGNAYFPGSGVWNSTGNVGIGTTSPGTILSLGNTGNNTINISATATSTFGSGVNLRTGCFAVNGVCVGNVSGTNFWTSLGDNIYNNTGTNVGIGTTTPGQILHISKTTGDSYLKIKNTGSTFGTNAAGLYFKGGNTNAQWLMCTLIKRW